MIDYLPWAIAHLAAWALMLLCATGFGNLFLRKYRFHNLAERSVFTITLGLGLSALVLFLLGLLGILYQSVIWVLTIAGAAATVLQFSYSHRRSLKVRQWKRILDFGDRKALFTLRNTVIGLVTVLAVCYWVLLLIKSQYPPHNWDSISNHLVIARENLKAHSLVVVWGIPMPVLPLLNHMLFTWGLALKDDILSQMVVHTFLMLTALGLYAWGVRQNRAALGCAAAALWLAHPLIQELGSTAYVDIGLTCFVFVGLYALRVFWDGRNVSWWYLGMALLAMAAGSKITGLFFVGLAALLGLWVLLVSFTGISRSTKKGSEEIVSVEHKFNWRSLVLGWAVALIIMLPWYSFVASHTGGNPLWPLFPRYSKGIWATSAADASWMITGFGQATLRKFLLLYIDFISYPESFQAENGLSLFPLIVAWPLAWIVGLLNRSVRWWVFWAFAFTVFWFLQAPLIRYWLPALPIAGLALCESIQWILGQIRRSPTLHNGVWVTTVIVILLWSGYEVGGKIALGLPPSTPRARETYLSYMNGYPGVQYVNAHAEKTDTVCVLSASWLNYYFDSRVIDLRGALYGNRKPIFSWPSDQLWTQWLEYEHVNWIFIYHQAPELSIPKQNPATHPFWPGYRLVYNDRGTWVFRREAVGQPIGFNRTGFMLKGLPSMTTPRADFLEGVGQQ